MAVKREMSSEVLPDNYGLFRAEINAVQPAQAITNRDWGKLIQLGLTAQFLTGNFGFEQQLLQNIVNLGNWATQQLVTKNIPLAIKIARIKSNQWPTISFEDILSAALEGLVRSAKRFNPVKGEFSTYATFYIYKEIGKEITGEEVERKHASVSIDDEQFLNVIEILISTIVARVEDVAIHDTLVASLYDRIKKFADGLGQVEQLIFLHYFDQFSEREKVSNDEIAQLLFQAGFHNGRHKPFSREWVRRQYNRIVELFIATMRQDRNFYLLLCDALLA